MSTDIFTKSDAKFSECRTYRYMLVRRWAESGGLCNFLMLNPSTADEVTNDPTVERCERRARALGCRGLIVTNLFAFRATDPKVMKAAADPVGPENDLNILFAANLSDYVICAWGQHGKHLGRADAVRKMLTENGTRMLALKVSANGEPHHPLYLSYDLKPTPYQFKEPTPCET